MKQLHFKTPQAWRDWLHKNHDREPEGVWLIFFKKDTGKASVDYNAAVEEALCYGWIDSIIKKLDDEKYARKFTPRKHDSKWSELNKKRVEKLIKQNRMAAPGLAKVEAAKQGGLWHKPDRPQISLELPPEFKQALAQNPQARKFFDDLAPSYKKQYIAWIAVAKRPETRENRIRESLALLQRGEKLGMK